MGSIVVTPKNAEELDFLIGLLNRLGFSAQIFTEEEEEEFYLTHELSDSGKAFLEKRAQFALESPTPLKSWQQVKKETVAKHTWPTN